MSEVMNVGVMNVGQSRFSRVVEIWVNPSWEVDMLKRGQCCVT